LGVKQAFWGKMQWHNNYFMSGFIVLDH